MKGRRAWASMDVARILAPDCNRPDESWALVLARIPKAQESLGTWDQSKAMQGGTVSRMLLAHNSPTLKSRPFVWAYQKNETCSMTNSCIFSQGERQVDVYRGNSQQLRIRRIQHREATSSLLVGGRRPQPACKSIPP